MGRFSTERLYTVSILPQHRLLAQYKHLISVMLVTHILSHEYFVLTNNVMELQRNIESMIFKLTGIVIEILKNSVIKNIVKTLPVKVGKRKVNKQKCLHLENSWLVSKEIEVTISASKYYYQDHIC